MQENRRTEFKVGMFLVIVLVLMTVMVFLMGREQRIFRKRAILHTTFLSAGGLKIGSQVRLAGLKIGVVEEIAFGTKTTDRRVYVRMKVLADSLSRVRSDSLARIQSRGLLGDSLVELTIGVKGEPLASGATVKGETSKGMADYMRDADAIVKRLHSSVESVDKILLQYRDPRLAKDVKRMTSALAGALERIKQGPGLAHDLLYSRKAARSIRVTLANLRRTSGLAVQTAGEVRKMATRARRAKGSVYHQLFVSDRGKQLMGEITAISTGTRKAIGSLNKILEAPNRRGTLLYTLLHTKQKDNLLANLTQASADLRTMMADIRRGKGTLGAIINDPTAFEDFKVILGQVKRSRIFRALIRFVIQRDDAAKGGRVRK